MIRRWGGRYFMRWYGIFDGKWVGTYEVVGYPFDVLKCPKCGNENLHYWEGQVGQDYMGNDEYGCANQFIT